MLEHAEDCSPGQDLLWFALQSITHSEVLAEEGLCNKKFNKEDEIMTIFVSLSPTEFGNPPFLELIDSGPPDGKSDPEQSEAQENISTGSHRRSEI